MQQDSHKPWKRLSQKTMYKGRIHVVKYEAELPTGEQTTYEVEYATSCAVAVLIKTADNQIILTYQYRFPLDAWIYDLPGGSKEADETIEEAVIRECREEVGLAPTKLEKLATFYPNPARTMWPSHLFYCEAFTTSKLELNDPSENVEVVRFSTLQIQTMINEGTIVDPALLIAWSRAKDKGYVQA